MGGNSASAAPPQQANILPSQGIFHAVVNRLADSNPDIGASVLAQRRRFQAVTQVNLTASIQKKTFALSNDNGEYTCEFKYDALTDCTVCIMQCVKEDSAHKLTCINASLPPFICELKEGKDQHFKDPRAVIDPATLLNITRRRRDVFALEAEAGPGVLLKERTFAMVERQNEGFGFKIFKQTMEAGSEVYALHGIYGENGTESSSAECIICLGYDKDTMILPCRHFCLCHNCAIQVSMEMKKCPICRNSTFNYSQK